MNVVLCFTVIIIHSVLAQINEQHEFTAISRNNVTLVETGQPLIDTPTAITGVTHTDANLATVKTGNVNSAIVREKIGTDGENSSSNNFKVTSSENSIYDATDTPDTTMKKLNFDRSNQNEVSKTAGYTPGAVSDVRNKETITNGESISTNDTLTTVLSKINTITSNQNEILKTDGNTPEARVTTVTPQTQMYEETTTIRLPDFRRETISTRESDITNNGSILTRFSEVTNGESISTKFSDVGLLGTINTTTSNQNEILKTDGNTPERRVTTVTPQTQVYEETTTIRLPDFRRETISTRESDITNNGSISTRFSEVTNGESISTRFSDVRLLSTINTISTEDFSTTLSTTMPPPAALPSCDNNTEVEFNITSINSYNITLEWEEPNCTADVYYIYLDGSIYSNTTELSFTIESLYACNVYSVGLATVNNSLIDSITSESFNTTIPEDFNTITVANLTVSKSTNNAVSVAWVPPSEEVVQCVTSYYLTYWDAENTETISQDIDANETFYSIPLIGCMNYTLQIYPKAGDSNNGDSVITSYYAEAVPFSAPRYTGVISDKQQTNITWITDDTSKNKCKINEIIVNCVAPLDQNSNFSWIIREAGINQQNISYSTDNRYQITVYNLSAFTNYSCTGSIGNTGGLSPETIVEFRTKEDVPSAPSSLTILDVGAHNFAFQWTEPEIVPGVLNSFQLNIINNGPLHSISDECQNISSNFSNTTGPDDRNFNFAEAQSYYKYVISVYAIDGAGNGEEATTNVTTKPSEPEKVKNATADPPVYQQTEDYNAMVTVKLEPPCNTNGPFKNYEVSCIGTREGFPDNSSIFYINGTSKSFNLLPERNYSITVRVVTENFTSAPFDIPPFQSLPGVPKLESDPMPPKANDTTHANFILEKSAFNKINGEIISYALILLTKNLSTSSNDYGFWEGSDHTWPALPPNSKQLTPKFWNPFQNGSENCSFLIGGDKNCSEPEIYCNKPLKENTKYFLLVRALTRAAYKDSSLLYFQTAPMPDEFNKLGLILGLIFGLLALIMIILILIFVWRRKRKNVVLEEEKRPSTTSPTAVPVQKFLDYYASIKENYSVVKQQYVDLGAQSKEVAGPTTFAVLPENRRKNRYTNILPYDATRVKLKIDEDDEISSDYINASYIKGYSGKIEYIATQGPLESTTRDFWKMILQEHVSIIVMVSQFVEQSKEKCYQYFPNNHETVSFGESLEVKCSTELHFGTYCVRTLKVGKGAEQHDVVHMQFLEWPDFGVPQGTDIMLQFCNQLREKVNKEGGLIVVHCSAGVGRTGTLIALDILLQTIDDHRDINIYKTVLDLRKQRTNMVQTEKQYMFIHTCVKDYIENPTVQTNDAGNEQIYENMDVIRSSMKKNLIKSQTESAL